jgi:hypothetical protein
MNRSAPSHLVCKITPKITHRHFLSRKNYGWLQSFFKESSWNCRATGRTLINFDIILRNIKPFPFDQKLHTIMALSIFCRMTPDIAQIYIFQAHILPDLPCLFQCGNRSSWYMRKF